MKRAFLLALAFTFALALGAWADVLSEATWTENWLETFDTYPSFQGSVLGKTSATAPPWTQSGSPQIKGSTDPANGTDVTVLCTTSTTGTYEVGRYAYRSVTPAGAGGYQRISMQVKATDPNASIYNTWALASNNEAPLVEGENQIPLWEFSSTTARVHVRVVPTGGVSNWIGAEITLTQNAWDTLDVVWDLSTGEAWWFQNGTLVQTLPDDSALKAFYLGRTAKNFEFWQVNYNVAAINGVHIDDLAGYGAIPEPSSLVAFATFGIGAFGLLRRRKA